MNLISRVAFSASLGSLCLMGPSSMAAVIWTVDASQSQLTLNIPNQPAKLPNGTPTGNLFVTNQGSGSGGWTQGNQAAISGTLSTDFVDGVSIRFRGGEHALTADNSGSYAPDPDNWDSGTQVFNPGNDGAAAAFGGQLNTTQTGVFPAVFEDVYRFSIGSVLYDLSSGVIPLTLNQFSAAATSFAMSDAEIGMRGIPGAPSPNTVPSKLGSPASVGLSLSGTNAAATATIASQPGLLTLTIPVSVPISWSILGNNFTGTAQGVIVATTVPEPGTMVLAALGGASLVVAGALRRRTRRAR